MSGLLRKPFSEMEGDDFDGMTPLGVAWRVLLAIIVLGVLGTVLSFAFGWFNAGVEVISPANVKAQFSHAYEDYESLKATAGNVCGAQQAVVDEPDPSIKSQRRTQLIAYQQTYRRIQADYDAAYDNAFKAKHVGPRDLPHDSPSLDEMLATVGCQVTEADPGQSSTPYNG